MKKLVVIFIIFLFIAGTASYTTIIWQYKNDNSLRVFQRSGKTNPTVIYSEYYGRKNWQEDVSHARRNQVSSKESI